MSFEWRRWFAFGTGAGIEIAGSDLHVTVARVRPSATQILGETTISGFRDRPASEWGAEYNSFLKRLGASHVAATVLLPRPEVIVRQIHMAGVSDKDLPAAIQFQIDGLHPYPEEEVVYDWVRIGETAFVLAGIARRGVIERYAALLAEAGVKVQSFTFSAAAIYSSMRMISAPPAAEFLAIYPSESESGGLEVYGESPARPIFSASFYAAAERARALAAAELRIAPDTEALALHQLLPPPRRAPEDARALPYATAMTSACPSLALKANLLPEAQRSTSSRAMFIPTAILATLLVFAVGALAAHSTFEDRKYMAALHAEIAKAQPAANKVEALDKRIADLRGRIALLDGFRQRSKADMDSINELTRLVAPPGWVNSMELTRESVTIAGETEQAAALLKLMDESPFFARSEFTIAITRAGTNEVFRIRSEREAGR
jgi:Tfp pilus assembly protein PilN